MLTYIDNDDDAGYDRDRPTSHSLDIGQDIVVLDYEHTNNTY